MLKLIIDVSKGFQKLGNEKKLSGYAGGIPFVGQSFGRLSGHYCTIR